MRHSILKMVVKLNKIQVNDLSFFPFYIYLVLMKSYHISSHIYKGNICIFVLYYEQNRGCIDVLDFSHWKIECGIREIEVNDQ